MSSDLHSDYLPQYRYVFTTPSEEAALYNVIQPQLVEIGIESINTHDKSIVVVDRIREVNPLPTGVPSVSLEVDQVSGQVNVLVSTLATPCVIPRTPAQSRVDLTENLVPATPVRLINHTSTLPPENSRVFAPSPVGIAIRTPNGANYVPAGSIKTPNGTIWTPKGASYSPGGTSYWPKGTVFTDEGVAVTPAGTMYQDGYGYGLGGHVYTPQGTAYSPSGLAYNAWLGRYQWKEHEKAEALSSEFFASSEASHPNDPNNGDREAAAAPFGSMPPGPRVSVSPSIYRGAAAATSTAAHPILETLSPNHVDLRPIPRPFIPGAGRLRSPTVIQPNLAPPVAIKKNRNRSPQLPNTEGLLDAQVKMAST